MLRVKASPGPSRASNELRPRADWDWLSWWCHTINVDSLILISPTLSYEEVVSIQMGGLINQEPTLLTPEIGQRFI